MGLFEVQRVLEAWPSVRNAQVPLFDSINDRGSLMLAISRCLESY